MADAAEKVVCVFEHCDTAWSETKVLGSKRSTTKCLVCGKEIKPTHTVNLETLISLINCPLTPDPANEDNDMILKDDATNIWIRDGNLTVYIRRMREDRGGKKDVPIGLAVEISAAVCCAEVLDVCDAEYADAKEFECTECGEYNGDGEGYDGLCGNCADKAEEED